MPERLYPPVIAGTLPAFCKSYIETGDTKVLKDIKITIPFTASAAVNDKEFVGFVLRLKTASTNTYLFNPIESMDFDTANSTVTFTIPPSQGVLLNEGQYYKVQLAYISQYTETEMREDPDTKETITVDVIKKLTGYYSTIGIIKCIQEPKVSVKGYSIDSINLFNNNLFGLYELSSDFDQSEKVYSYNFSFYTEDGELYYTTGELLHNNSNDIEYGISTDSVILSSFIKTSEVYKLVYTVTTLNGYVASSPMYRVTAETLLAPSKSISIIAKPYPNSGCINVNFHGIERVVRQENVIKQMTRINTYYNYSKNLMTKLKRFYQGANGPDNPQIKEWVDRIQESGFIVNILEKYRIYLRDNISLLNEMCGISTGILESLIMESKEFDLYLGEYLGTVIDNIGKEKEEINYYNLFSKFLWNTTVYIATSFEGYKNLNIVLQNRVNSYLNYLQDSINGDETELDQTVINQSLINLCQNIITTANLSTELAKEYLHILGYDADIEYQVDKQEDTYFGQYILVRASEEDEYRSWLELKRFKLENMKPSLVDYNDYTVKQGVKYIYGIIQYNLFGIYSSRIESEPVSVDFEDIFLYDGDRVLKIKFNPKVSSFKTTVLEQKTNTIGNKFPFIFRNGKVAYKEFPISGLISYQMDDEILFYDREIQDYIRTCTDHADIKNSAEFFNHMEKVLENPCDLIENNIHKERNFKMEVLDWLNNGQPKLFRSGPEGNFIVRIMNVSMSPVDTLGRMLHSFTGQCVEIADLTYENLLKYGFIKSDIVSKYISLWRSYYLNEYEPGMDIIIDFESNNISQFSVQDLLPGSSIFLTYGDVSEKIEDEILIGITGSYTYNNSNRKISRIRIPNDEYTHPVGILECQYQGVRYGDFDAITEVKLKTILSHQFVGVNPVLTELDTLVYKQKTQSLTESDINKFKNALSSLNERIVLNKLDANSAFEKIYDTLAAKGFEPGNIMSYINTQFYDYAKDKLKVLNLEQLHIKVRELIPIYAVPYEYVTPEGWAKITAANPSGVPWAISDGKATHVCLPQADGSYSKYDYEENFGSQYLLYSVSPFGQPYPIDELTPKVREYFNVNDEFCVFQMYEYFPQFDSWMPTQRTNIFGVKTGQYYDCYWKSVIDDFDTSFYINEKYRYEKLHDIQYDEELGLYYILIKNKKTYLNDELELYVQKDGKYKLVKDVYIIPKGAPDKYQDYINNQIEALNNLREEKLQTAVISDHKAINDFYDAQIKSLEDSLKNATFYKTIKNDNELIHEKDYLSTAIRWLNKEDYNPVPEFYHNDWTVDENNIAKSIVQQDQIKDFYIRFDNSVKLEYDDNRYFSNLKSPDIIKIGTGLIAEATFQLEILDYYTEVNNSETKRAKDNYIQQSEFLRSLYRNYELIAEADNNFQKYLTLTRSYNTLLNGLPESNNIPYEDSNDYQSRLDGIINWQDRNIINEILNTMKPTALKNFDIADLWSDDITEEKKAEIKETVLKIIKRMQINKSMYTELKLQDEEEQDLLDLIQQPTKEGINSKLNKLDSLLQSLYNNQNSAIENANSIANNYSSLLNQIYEITDKNGQTLSDDGYNAIVYRYKAALWLYCLIYQSIGNQLINVTASNYDSIKDNLEQIESSINITEILTNIKNHYNRVLAGLGSINTSEAEARRNQMNYYIDAWTSIQGLYDTIMGYLAIIKDQDSDNALDKLLYQKILGGIQEILWYYGRLKQSRRNLNKLLGQTDNLDFDTKSFIDFIGTDDNNNFLYPFNDCVNLIEKLKEVKLDLDDADTLKDLFYISDIIDVGNTIASDYTALNLKLQGGTEQNGLTDEDSSSISKFILAADKLDYIYQSAKELNWPNQIMDTDVNLPSELNYYLQKSITFSGQEDAKKRDLLYCLAFRDRLLYSFYYYEDSIRKYADSYITKLDSSVQSTIRSSSNRNIILDIESNGSDEGDNSIFNSVEFDQNTYSLEATNIRIAKINKLLYIIDNNCLPVKENGYKYVLDTIISLIIPNTTNNYINTGFSRLLEANNIITNYNSIITNYQQLLVSNGINTSVYKLVGKINKDDIFLTLGKYYYLENNLYKQATLNNYDLNVDYYLNEKDYLIKSFIDYFNQLAVSANDQKNNNYNFIEPYLTATKLANLQQGTFNLYSKNNFIPTILSEENQSDSEDIKKHPERDIIDNIINYTYETRSNFISNNIGGDNALSDYGTLKSVLELYNSNLDGLYTTLLETYKSLGNKIFIQDKINSLNDLSEYKVNTSETNPTVNEVRYQHLLMLKGLAKVSELCYWCNTQLFNEYRIDPLLIELFTNLPKLSKANENYPSITSMGIFYWYIENVLNKDINAYKDAIEQAEFLITIYTNKQENYKTKAEYYQAEYEKYLTIFRGFLSTRFYEYYAVDTASKDKQMRELIEAVKDAWNKFILTLDRGFTKEIEAGMYQ